MAGDFDAARVFPWGPVEETLKTWAVAYLATALAAEVVVEAVVGPSASEAVVALLVVDDLAS